MECSRVVEEEEWDCCGWRLKREARVIRPIMEGGDFSISMETDWIRTARVFGDCWEDSLLYGTLWYWSHRYACSVEMV